MPDNPDTILQTIPPEGFFLKFARLQVVGAVQRPSPTATWPAPRSQRRHDAVPVVRPSHGKTRAEASDAAFVVYLALSSNTRSLIGGTTRVVTAKRPSADTDRPRPGGFEYS